MRRPVHRRVRYKETGPAIERMSQVTEVQSCRVCRSSRLWRFFTLGDQPLANDLVPADRLDREDLIVPLAVMRCEDCFHVQLTHTVPARILFTNYRFLSGTSEGWHQHCERLVDRLTYRRGAGFVVDIGANDGTLLSKFKRLGWKTLGVDPATAVARTAPVRMECTEWNCQTAEALTKDYGKADLIIAQNVLGHVDDPGDFMDGVKAMLKKDGEAIIEVPDVTDLLKHQAFDTIYHEHLSYWSTPSAVKLMSQSDLVVVNFRDFPGLHGGSMRLHVRHKGKPTATVGGRLVHDYRAMQDREPFALFQQRVEDKLQRIGELFTTAARPFWGYSSPAKATVLLNALHARGFPVPEWIVDDTLAKQGYYIPRVRVPIVAPESLEHCRTLAIFAWNWAEGIKERAKHRNFTGQYLIPLPTPRIDDA